jgi:cobalt-zinc-cadmium efflux system membrane fusion protein
MLAPALAGCQFLPWHHKNEATSNLPPGQIVYMGLEAQKLAGIQVDTAQCRLIDYSVTTTGEVLANANLLTHVTTPVNGRVMDINVIIGDHVKSGDVLLTLRSNDIEQAEADLLQNIDQVAADLKRDLLDIDSQIETAKAQIQLSESSFNRMRSLVDEKIASRADFEKAHTGYERDKITLDALQRKHDSTIALSHERMQLLTAPIVQKLNLLGVPDAEIRKVEQTKEVDPIVPLLAPETGIVSERLVNIGELVDPSKSLFTIADFHDVWIKADIYEKDVPKIHNGQAIELELDSFPGKKFDGRLNYVAETINPDTRTLSVRADVPNPGLILKPQMFARMKILVGEQNVLAVPDGAIQDASDHKVVYIPLGNGQFLERMVTVGADTGSYIEILHGLKPGNPVVIQGSFDLRAESVRASS